MRIYIYATNALRIVLRRNQFNNLEYTVNVSFRNIYCLKGTCLSSPWLGSKIHIVAVGCDSGQDMIGRKIGETLN